MYARMEKCIEDIKAGKITENIVLTLLTAYYDGYYDSVEETKKGVYPIEFTRPLSERESGIVEAIDWVIDNYNDMNIGDSPLVVTVGYADAPMTSFLINNGADATYWEDKDEWDEDVDGNYYLEEIDLGIFWREWNLEERFVQASLQTARVLLCEGHVGSYYGFCLKASVEEKKVTLSEACMKY